MIVYVDIDETICVSPESRDYSLASPIMKNIEKINKLFDEGNTIVYWTARGTATGIDWSATTRRQLTEWGAKFHEVKFHKPHYDIFICDKAVNTNDFFKN